MTVKLPDWYYDAPTQTSVLEGGTWSVTVNHRRGQGEVLLSAFHDTRIYTRRLTPDCPEIEARRLMLEKLQQVLAAEQARVTLLLMAAP
jgi:hypothetical protein